MRFDVLIILGLTSVAAALPEQGAPRANYNPEVAGSTSPATTQMYNGSSYSVEVDSALVFQLMTNETHYNEKRLLGKRGGGLAMYECEAKGM